MMSTKLGITNTFSDLLRLDLTSINNKLVKKTNIQYSKITFTIFFIGVTSQLPFCF